ncbi:MAG: Gfo/Idh/MocA family oxidoreductase [Gemmatimonadetes bacterium]|nr:Gfo/Idh/MocA family oxidoreductase [Gemmatimonadota bacterium]
MGEALGSSGDERIRIGFVGAGFMGQLVHLPNLTEMAGCEVVALADRRPRLARLVADRFGIPEVCGSHEKLCADASIDAIVQITSDDAHAPVSIDALNAGKHVYLEKPMATNLSDARRMVEAAGRNERQLMVGYMKRFDTGVELARSIIDDLKSSGELGTITHARGHCFAGNWVCNAGTPIQTDEPYPEIEPRPPAWLEEERIGEIYSINNLYCHNINLMRYLLGDVRALRFASLDGPTRLMVFTMDGYEAVLELGKVTADFWDEGVKVYFEDGWIEIHTPPPLLKNVPARVSVYRAGAIQQHVQPQAPRDWAFRRANVHFVTCIQSGATVRSSGADSIRDQELLEEAFRRF